MNAQLSGDLLRLLEIKKELLARLLDTVNRAAGLLKDDDMDGFGTEMESCKNITDMVDELIVNVNRLKAQMPEMQRQPEIVRIESGITYIMEQIDSAHRECNNVAEQKLHEYGLQMKAIQQTKKGIDRYANQFQSRDAFFIDAKK